VGEYEHKQLQLKKNGIEDIIYLFYFFSNSLVVKILSYKMNKFRFESQPLYITVIPTNTTFIYSNVAKPCNFFFKKMLKSM